MAQQCNPAVESAGATLGSITGILAHKPWDMVFLLLCPVLDAALHGRHRPVEESAEDTKVDKVCRKFDWQGKIEDRGYKTEERL